jgi:hypothetical protein
MDQLSPDHLSIDRLLLSPSLKQKLRAAGLVSIVMVREAIRNHTLEGREGIGRESAAVIETSLAHFGQQRHQATIPRPWWKRPKLMVPAAAIVLAALIGLFAQRPANAPVQPPIIPANNANAAERPKIANGKINEDPVKPPVAGEKPVPPPAEPTITLKGLPFNEKQKTSLDSLRIALKEPDEVFNSTWQDYQGKPLENWICKFESVGGKPDSPKDGRKFIVVFDDTFKATCFLKPGVEGKELTHLQPGHLLTLTKAWVRYLIKEPFADESGRDLVLVTKGRFRLINCELKMPL